MKKTIITLFSLLLIVGTTRADDTIQRDTIFWSQGEKAEIHKRIADAMKKAEESLKRAEEQIRQTDKRLKERRYGLPDSLASKLKFADKWTWGEEYIDLSKEQKPLIDLSNIKGRWGFEDYYFSGDILHAQARRNGDFYIGGWNIRPLLPRLSGLLVLKSKKKAAEKIIFSRVTQLRNDQRFQPIVRDKGITIYGHRTIDKQLDEVIILQDSRQSSTNEYTYIVQMMGKIRPDDLTSYVRLCDPPFKVTKVKP